MSRKSLKILICGFGNLAQNIYEVLKKHPDFSFTIASDHLFREGKKKNLPLFKINDKKFRKEYYPDVVWVLTKDEDVNKKISYWHIKYPEALFISSSAVVNINERKKENIYLCTLYPLGNFTAKNLIKTFSSIPLLIDYGPFLTPGHKKMINKICLALKGRSIKMTYEERLPIHIAAVLISNFNHALCYAALKIAGKQKKLLLPILQQTMENLKKMNPGQTITGPAIRGELFTIKKHLQFLSPQKNIRKLYITLTRYIQSSIPPHHDI